VIDKLIEFIERRVSAASPPERIRDLVEEALQVHHSQLRAFELSGIYTTRIKDRLAQVHRQMLEVGEDPWFAFNSLSDDFLQGPCFVEPSDPPELRAAKINRARATPMERVLEAISFDEFEIVCAAVLALIGARECHRSVRSNDQGIDFYGQLYLGDLDIPSFPFARFQDNFKIWLVGQAKHYPGRKVSTPDIRNLVGSINLARFKEYAATTDLMQELPMRSCDPVVVLFLTTGKYTRDAVRLGTNSGVLLRDLTDLAKLLADKTVGVDGFGVPSAKHLVEWASQVITASG
jgi:Restriction endonuclease